MSSAISNSKKKIKAQGGMVWQLIDNLYKNVQAMVKFGYVSTDFFKMDKGVKQGCGLSPVLFCIYIHQFTKLLNGWQLAKMKKSIPDMSLP